MTRMTNFVGETFGEWCVMSKAPAMNHKRYWNCINKITDETAVVAQTDLKKLGEGRFHPSTEDFLHALGVSCVADDNCLITEDGKHAIEANRPEGDSVPSSAEITARVVAGNYANDPFNIPDGILPEDDSEYPFEPDFIEPIGTATVFEDEHGLKIEYDGNPFDIQMSAGFDYDDDEDIPGAEEFVADWVAPRNVVNNALIITGSPWKDPKTEVTNEALLELAEIAEKAAAMMKSFSNALCDIVEARI